MSETKGLIEIEIDSCYTGRGYLVKVNPNDVVKTIKKSLDRIWNIPSSRSILLFEGRELDNYDIIKDVGIKGGSKLQLVMNMNGGPVDIRRVVSADLKRLKDAVEKARKDLSKKYPNGVRVLVILHKDSTGQYNVVRVFDAIQDGESVCEAERPRSPPGTPPKESSPCRLIKYRRSYTFTYDLDDEWRNQKVKDEDHEVIMKKLAEERNMKLKLNDLRQRMNELANQKKSRKGLRKISKKFVISSPWVSRCRKIKELPDFYDKCLYFKSEFTYPTFMAAYYEKQALTPEMKGFKHITFRVVKEQYPTEEEDCPMIVYKEDHALQEKCRKKSLYMIIKDREPVYNVALRFHENRKRLEIDYLELALKRRGFSVEEIEKYMQDFMASEDINHRQFMANRGLNRVADLTTALEQIDLLEASDVRAYTPNHKRTIFQTINPLFADSSESSSSMDPPYSYNSTASSGSSIMTKNLLEGFEKCVEEYLTKKSPPTSEKSRQSTYRRASDPFLPPVEPPLEDSTNDSGDSSDSSSTISSPASSTSESSTSSGESDAQTMLIDIEDDDGANCEVTTDLDDTLVADRGVVRKRSGKEISLPSVEKVKKTKCSVCKRKLNITNVYDCRCGNLFCAQHRHAELHQCSFDYRKKGKEMIAKQNPQIKGEKIRKI